MLNKGNLSPKEKFLLLIHNDVERMKTGKDALTKADKEALEGWSAKTNGEAHEWNRLNEGWKKVGRLELEAEFYFNEAQTAHMQTKPVIMELLRTPMYREMGKMLNGINSIKKVSAGGAQEIVDKQRAVKLAEGIDFDYAVYRYAFELLNEEDRNRLLDLYEDVETDHQYLDEEEVIANLLNGAEHLTEEAKQTLAQLVAGRAYNAYAKEYQLFHYFACIPLAEIARHFLSTHHVSIEGKRLVQNQEADDEDDYTHDEIRRAVEVYATEHATTVNAILKEGFISWYDTNGWEYTPLIVSEDKDLFKRWLVTKVEARKKLEELVAEGTLSVRSRTPEETHKNKLYSKALESGETQSIRTELELLQVNANGSEIEEKKAFVTFSDTVLTGDSLYAFDTDFKFITDFKERVNEYDPNLGLVYADDDPEHKGQHLDRELLLCSLDGTGEPSFFSVFAMSFGRLEVLTRSMAFMKEEEQDGELHLLFTNEQVEQVFRESIETFITAYGKLLAIRNLFQKISPEYKVDLAFRVKDLLATLDAYIETHNEALQSATMPLPMGKLRKNKENAKPISTFDESLRIDKESIVSDEAVYEEHHKGFQKALWDY